MDEPTGFKDALNGCKQRGWHLYFIGHAMAPTRDDTLIELVTPRQTYRVKSWHTVDEEQGVEVNVLQSVVDLYDMAVWEDEQHVATKP